VRDHWGGVAAFNYDVYSLAFYTVDRHVKRKTVKFDDCQHKGYVPPQLYAPGSGPFLDVPIPRHARPARGTDGSMAIWDRSSDQLWELWQARKAPDGWHACWGGRIDRASTDPGYFEDYMGVSGSGLALSGGSVGIREAGSGAIKHAMALQLIDVANWSTFSYPAQRSDGYLPPDTPNAIMEGQRFRLDPSVDLDRLDLTPLAKTIARAAQKYGFIVTDQSGAVDVVAESGLGLARETGVNPWDKIMRGVPGYEVLENFPWDRLQALPVDYGKP
jgi:hypothetical protein